MTGVLGGDDCIGTAFFLGSFDFHISFLPYEASLVFLSLYLSTVFSLGGATTAKHPVVQMFRTNDGSCATWRQHLALLFCFIFLERKDCLQRTRKTCTGKSRAHRQDSGLVSLAGRAGSLEANARGTSRLAGFAAGGLSPWLFSSFVVGLTTLPEQRRERTGTRSADSGSWVFAGDS